MKSNGEKSLVEKMMDQVKKISTIESSTVSAILPHSYILIFLYYYENEMYQNNNSICVQLSVWRSAASAQSHKTSLKQN